MKKHLKSILIVFGVVAVLFGYAFLFHTESMLIRALEIADVPMELAVKSNTSDAW